MLPCAHAIQQHVQHQAYHCMHTLYVHSHCEQPDTGRLDGQYILLMWAVVYKLMCLMLQGQLPQVGYTTEHQPS